MQTRSGPAPAPNRIFIVMTSSVEIKIDAGRDLLRNTPFAAGVLALMSAVALTPFGRLDYDRVHDGWMLAGAVSVKSGRTLHTDVFNQFGPVATWTQSLFLSLPVSPALALRLVTILMIAGTVFLLADMGRLRSTGFPVTQSSGLLAAVAWLVLSDVWGVGPMRPWPVFFTNFLVVLSAYLVSRAWMCIQESHLRRARVLLLCAGASIGIALFTRVASGLVILAALAVCALAASRACPSVVRLAAWILPGFLLGAGLIVASLGMSGSLADFYGDSIVWPLEFWKPGPMEPLHFILEIAPVYSPPVLIGALGLVFVRRCRLSGRRLVATTSLVGLAMLGVTFLLAGLAIHDDYASYFSAGRGLLLFLMSAIASTLAVLLWASIRIVTEGRASPTYLAWIAMSMFSFGALAEITPDYTLRHVWWSLPMGLLLLFAAVPKFSGSRQALGNPLIVPLVAIALYSAYIGALNVSATRVEAPAVSLAAGMQVAPRLAREITDDLAILDEHVNAGTAIYLTATSDLAILGGRYTAADPYFTCYGLLPPLSQRVATASAIVVEREVGICPELDVSQLAEFGFVEVARNERLTIYGRK